MLTRCCSNGKDCFICVTLDYYSTADSMRCSERQGGVGDHFRSLYRRQTHLGCIHPKPYFGSRWPFSSRSHSAQGLLVAVWVFSCFAVRRFLFCISVFIYRCVGRPTPNGIIHRTDLLSTFFVEIGGEGPLTAPIGHGMQAMDFFIESI